MRRLIDYLPDWVELLPSTMNIYIDIPVTIEKGTVRREDGLKIVELELNIGGTKRIITVEDSRLLTAAIQKAVEEKAFPLSAALIWAGYRWWLA